MFLCYFLETGAIRPKIRINHLEPTLKSDTLVGEGEGKGARGGLEDYIDDALRGHGAQL